MGGGGVGRLVGVARLGVLSGQHCRSSAPIHPHRDPLLTSPWKGEGDDSRERVQMVVFSSVGSPCAGMTWVCGACPGPHDPPPQHPTLSIDAIRQT